MKPKTLREYKENKGLTNPELAQALGTSEIYVSMLLNGRRAPSKKLAQRINALTGIPILNLLYPQGDLHA
jgi:transcriptional regulator with XRE-family HTH domain